MSSTGERGAAVFHTALFKLRSGREVQAPSFGYPTEGAYYRDASSVDSLLAMKIPVFAISAEDDPVGRVALKNVYQYHLLNAVLDRSRCGSSIPGDPTKPLRMLLQIFHGRPSRVV